MLDRFHIVLSTAQPLSRQVIHHVASAVGLSPYDVRLRLNSKLPRSVAFRSDRDEAVALARRVVARDVVVVVYRESAFPLVSPFNAFRMGRTPDGLVFEDRSGARRPLDRSDMEFVVFGKKTSISTETNLEYAESSIVLHERTHVSPPLKVVKKRNKAMSTFIVFFPRDRDLMPIRIVTNNFDFQCLGRDIGMSDLVSAGRLVTIIEEVTHRIPSDRRLMETDVVESMIAHNRRASPDPEYAASALLLLEHLAIQGGEGFHEAVHSRSDDRS